MNTIFRVIACAGASIVIFAASAQAQDEKYSAEYEKCWKDAGFVDPLMQECNVDEIERQDGILNSAYRQIMAMLAKGDHQEERESLQQAERAWIAFRDAQCSFERAVGGDGSEARIRDSDCRLEMTYERAKVLSARLEFYKKFPPE